MESISPDDLAATLTSQLSDPGGLPTPRFAPQLSYGRHRGPSPNHARQAAVAVALYRDPDRGWTIPLTLRPNTLQHHGGQICLPGGRIEAGESSQQAALREYAEELGVQPVVRSHCGELSRQYVYASDNLVHPVVSVIEPPMTEWIPDPVEVGEVITLPLRVVTEQQHRLTTIKRRKVLQGPDAVGELTFEAVAMEFEGHRIWGATALILDQLAQILQRSARD